MPSGAPIFETSLEGLTPHHRGKVRDLYEVDDCLLIVATDRISAFDFVLGSAIPDKGKVLTQLSAFWFDRTRDLVPNHMLSTRPQEYPRRLPRYAGLLSGRSMLVRRTTPVPIECVARGVPVWFRLEGVPANRSGLRDHAAGWAAGVRPAPRADFHARHQGGHRTRHQHQ